MDLPTPPTLAKIDKISPSFYNAGLLCKAKAAWQKFGVRQSMPASTGSILGSCLHAVVERGNRGGLSPGREGIEQAKIAFDAEAKLRFSEAHPLIRAKFASPEKIPFYFQRRARAVVLAVQVSTEGEPRSPSPPQGDPAPRAFGGRSSRLVEQSFTSRDGLITGRIDLLDSGVGKVTDYKSGHAPKNVPSGLADTEVRQLRLYIHLALENGYNITRATIVRGDGNECEIQISASQAADEAQAARALMEQFNGLVSGGCSFSSLANPSAKNCAGCPCIPFCEPFWKTAQPDWEELCGTNAEGEISETKDVSLAGATLKTLTLDCRQGSTLRGQLTIEQIPLAWLSLGSSVPALGSAVRIVLAARSTSAPQIRVLQVDRIKSTTIWNLSIAPPQQ
jgi:hypothetical protein